MKKIITVFILTVIAVAAAFAAEKPLGVPQYTSVEELASEITSYFPKVQGEVQAVAGERLTISLGAKDGLRSGMILTLWRDGREILHPVTGAVIGRAEVEIGGVEVTDVGESASTGIMSKRLKDPKAGDKARITPKKIALALLPDGVDRPEIGLKLASKLDEYGRFSVLDSDKTAAFLKDRNERTGSLIKDLGRAFKLDVVATVGVYPSEERYLVTTKLFYADDARPLDTIVALLDLRTKKDALGDVKPFFAPAPAEKEGIAKLPINALLFVAADLEGTGSLQYVFSDGGKVHVYKHGPSGWSEEWKENVGYGAREMRHFNLDAADINGNGKPEIFVTGMLNGRITSYVLESQDGVYRRIVELPEFLRVVRDPRQGTVLIGQAYDPVSFYSGVPKRYVWRGDRYVPEADFPLPSGLGLYGFALVDSGDAQPLIVALDEAGKLLVYVNGSPVWKSEEQYPFVGIVVKKPVTGIDAAVAESAAENNKLLQVPIPGRVIALDVNGDGREEIIVPKNSGATFLREHREAEFIGLGWTGTRLDSRWRVKETEGAVLDFQLLAAQGKGVRIMTLVKSPGGIFKSDSYQVKLFPVP